MTHLIVPPVTGNAPLESVVVTMEIQHIFDKTLYYKDKVSGIETNIPRNGLGILDIPRVISVTITVRDK